MRLETHGARSQLRTPLPPGGVDCKGHPRTKGSLVRRTISILLIPASIALCSCSLFPPATQPITIIPSHQNAEVFADGELHGRGTRTVELHKKRSHSIMVKCGDSAAVTTIRRRLSTTGIFDIIGGVLVLIPIIGLAAPGAFRLTPTTAYVVVPDASACEQDL